MTGSLSLLISPFHVGFDSCFGKQQTRRQSPEESNKVNRVFLSHDHYYEILTAPDTSVSFGSMT
jgi:hypothetical protein